MTNAGCTELPSCQSTCSMYFYNPNSLTGSSAQQFAESLGANLISVQSAAENTCIGAALASNNFNGVVWIGLTDEINEGTFVWYDGTPVGFTNWRPGEPNSSGDEDCVQIFADGSWNDLNCNSGGTSSVIEVSLCPQITASNDTTICNSTSANLVCSDATFGSPPYNYTWSTSETGQSISVSPTVTTTYTVRATDRYGCYVEEDIVVTVVDNITASFTSSNYCLGDAVVFTDNSTVTAPDMIDNSGWDFGDGSTPAVGNQVSYEYATAGNYVVSHAVSSVNGCMEIATENITIYNPPTAEFTFNDECTNTDIPFQDNSAGAGTTVISWEWDFGDGIGTGSNDTEDYQYSTSGSYDVELIIEDNEGCKDTVTNSVTIFESPIADFSFDNVCVGETAEFTDASTVSSPSSIVNWAWDFNNDLSPDAISQNASHDFNSSGDFIVNLGVVSDNGCIGTSTQTISVYNNPNASFSASTVCVNGNPTDFVNSSTSTDGVITNYGWNFGDGNISFAENPTNNYQIASTYPVTLGVATDLGCVDTVTFSIDVLGKPSAAFTQDTTNGCAPLCVAFTDTSFDDVPIIEWNWKFENSFGESFEQNPTYCYTTTADYDVSLIIKNQQGCKDTLNKTNLISLYPQPTSDFTLNPESTDVQNAEITFTNNSIDAAAWKWDFNDGSDENLVDYDPVHNFGDTGTYEVELIVINSFLCSDTSYQSVEIFPVDDLFVPSGFSPNGDGKNDVLFARGFIGVMYFAVFDRLGNKVFESEDESIGWDGQINGKNAIEGVYTWYLQAEVNGKAKKIKGDITLVR